MTKTKPTVPYIETANGFVKLFTRDGKNVKMRLKGYMPLKWQLANMKTCTLKQNGAILEPYEKKDGLYSYQIKERDSNEIQISCE